MFPNPTVFCPNRADCGGGWASSFHSECACVLRGDRGLYNEKIYSAAQFVEKWGVGEQKVRGQRLHSRVTDTSLSHYNRQMLVTEARPDTIQQQ